MKKILFFITCFFQATCFFQSTYAWDLFETLTKSHNGTMPTIHKSATAGYISGGGVSWRTHRNSIVPLNISFPSIKSGCDGIDFFGGSMSMINGQKLKQLGLDLIKQAPSFALHLALKTYIPQVEAVMSKFEGLVTMVNQANIDTCQILRSASAAYLPNSDLKKTACKEFQMSGGNNDFFGASEKCKDPQKVKNFEGKLPKNEDGSPQRDFVTPKNIIFAAALNSGMQEKEAEILMTLVGTIILKASPPPSSPPNQEVEYSTDDIQPVFYSSLIKADDFEKYLDGNSVHKQYKCVAQSAENGVKCLKLEQVEIKSTESLSLKGIREKTRLAIENAIQGFTDNSTLSKETVNFLESQYSIVPIFDWLLVVAKGVMPKEALGEVFPEYIFLNYLRKTLNEALTILYKEMPTNLSLQPHFIIKAEDIKALQKTISNKVSELESKLKMSSKQFEVTYRKLLSQRV